MAIQGVKNVSLTEIPDLDSRVGRGREKITAIGVEGDLVDGISASIVVLDGLLAADIEDLEKVKPVYETLTGWQEPTNHCREWSDLPVNAQRYLKRVEELVGAPVAIVSVGPDRAETFKVRRD